MNLEQIIRKTKYALTIPAIALAINTAEAQNIVDVHIQSVPSLKDTVAKVMFTDVNSGDKYWGKTDINGRITLDMPSSNYEMLIEGVNDFRIRGYRTINSNTNTLIQPIENVPTNSAPYTDILQVFEILTYSFPGSGKPIAMRWTTPIRLWTNSNQPTWMKPIQDSVLARYGYKTHNAIEYNLAATDSAGARILYLPNDQLPIYAQGFDGYTDPNANNDTGYTDVTMYINTTLVQNSDQALGTINKEMERCLMFVDYSQCQNHMMRARNLGGPVILEPHPDEYMSFNILYHLQPLTNMDEYKDTVVTILGLELPSNPKAVSPSDGSSDIDTSTVFVWKKIKYQDIDRYGLQLVKDTTSMDGLIADSAILDTMKILTGLMHNQDYFWRANAHNIEGWGNYTNWNKFKTVITGIDNEKIIPNRFALYQNYPNPFNPTTRILYSIKQNSHVKLEIYNTIGQLVREIDEGIQHTGTYEETFNANGLSSGIYLYRLTANPTTGTEKTYTETKKMLLIK